MKNSEKATIPVGLRVYEATPGISILLLPDKPSFTIVSVSDDFVRLTGTKREDVVGKGHFQFFDDLPDSHVSTGIEELRASFDYVITERKPHEIPAIRYDLPGENGAYVKKFWKVNNAPILDDTGQLMYFIHSITDITDKVEALEELQSVPGMKKAYQFFMNAPVIIGYAKGDDYTIELANERLLEVWERSKDVIGKPLFKAIPELEHQGVKALLDEVRSSGKPFFAYEHPLTFHRKGKTETLYFDFVYQPHYENDDDRVATGVISVGHDVTEQVRTRHKFRHVIDQAQDPILIFKGREMVLEVANKALFRLWQIDESAIGRTFLEILPEMKDQGFLEKLQRVYDTGEPFQGYEIPADLYSKDGSKRTVYFNFSYQPYREPDGLLSGVLVLATDATEQVRAREEFRQSQKKWRDLADSMPTIVWTSSPDGMVNFFNDQWYKFTGLSEKESLGQGWLTVLHPEDLDRCMKVWENANSGGDFYEVEIRYRRRDHEYRWMIARGVPIKKDGRVLGWYGTSSDIHEQKQLESLLEEKVRERTNELQDKNKLLDNILTHSSNGISVSEMIFDESGNVVDALTILANEAAIKFSGLPRDIYLTQKASAVDPNIIGSPYGQACVNTLRTGKPTVMQYFLEFSSRWLELTVSRMDDAHLIHIFTDVTSIKTTQLQLERSLEDLKYANANLEEFAYAASHDMKEPVRKIRYFSSRLKEELQDKIDANQLRHFDRLENASSRMLNLIDNLLEYSQATKGTSLVEEIDLAKSIQQVLDDLELEIQKRGARVNVGELPAIKANKRQMHQLFLNLISNALKYCKPGIAPEIMIASRVVTGKEALPDFARDIRENRFHHITVSDNGIGFDQKYAESIFNVFTRLHSDVQYRGSGIGLSIVKKVVESHNGLIWAESVPQRGSTFKILLPVHQ